MPSRRAAVWQKTDSPPHPAHPAASRKPVRPQDRRGVRENSSPQPTAKAAHGPGRAVRGEISTLKNVTKAQTESMVPALSRTDDTKAAGREGA